MGNFIKSTFIWSGQNRKLEAHPAFTLSIIGSWPGRVDVKKCNMDPLCCNNTWPTGWQMRTIVIITWKSGAKSEARNKPSMGLLHPPLADGEQKQRCGSNHWIKNTTNSASQHVYYLLLCCLNENYHHQQLEEWGKIWSQKQTHHSIHHW